MVKFDEKKYMELMREINKTVTLIKENLETAEKINSSILGSNIWLGSSRDFYQHKADLFSQNVDAIYNKVENVTKYIGSVYGNYVQLTSRIKINME